MKSSTNPLSQKSFAAWVVCCLLFLAVALVFGRAAWYGFVNFDDNAYVYENPVVLKGLTAQGVVWAFSNSWPATWLSLMLDAEFYGPHAGGYHVTNILLHAATAIGLFLVFWRMTGRLWTSALVAALFAIHPLRAESVVWVTERKDVLSGLFFMLTLGAYVGYVRRPSLAKYALMTFCFALGLMAKPILVTLPCVLLLLDYWPLGRLTTSSCDSEKAAEKSRRNGFAATMRLVVEKIPLFLMVAVACVITYKTQGKSFAHSDCYPLAWKIENGFISYITYLGQFFWPSGLAVSYPRLPLDLPQWKVWTSLLILLAITAATIAFRRRCPYLLVGWLWYLGMLVPVIGLLQVGVAAVADRFTYLPQIGIGMALAWGIADLCGSQPWRRRAFGTASVLALLLLMGCAWRQTAYWRNSESLWRHALACNAQDAYAQGSLGLTLHEAGKIEEAVGHYQKAIALRPDEVVYNNLGIILAGRQQYDKAVRYFEMAVKISPEYAGAHANLGHILADQGHLDEAVDHFRKSLAFDSNNPDTYCRLGNALYQQGKDTEAAESWRKAIQLNPTNLNCVRQLASLLATSPDASVRNGAESLELSQWAVRLSQGQAALDFGTLAAAYAETGQFPKAVEAAKKALALALAEKNAGLADELRTQLKLYQTGLPFHKPRQQYAK
jgi:tetratricopeptide (TPR) repeat protein